MAKPCQKVPQGRCPSIPGGRFLWPRGPGGIFAAAASGFGAPGKLSSGQFSAENGRQPRKMKAAKMLRCSSGPLSRGPEVYHGDGAPEERFRWPRGRLCCRCQCVRGAQKKEQGKGIVKENVITLVQTMWISAGFD